MRFLQCFHGITELQGLEGTSGVTQPNLLLKQGHPEQAVEDHVQAGRLSFCAGLVSKGCAEVVAVVLVNVECWAGWQEQSWVRGVLCPVPSLPG